MDLAAVKRALAIAEMDPSTTTVVESSARFLGDWLADTELLQPPEVVIPHLAVEGRASLVSGREKIGKTTLVAGAVGGASRGEPVLGTPLTDNIRTLWFALDEPVADTVRRFAILGSAHDGILINAEPRTCGELMDALERDLETFPDVGVVVVDTLSRVLATSGIDPNSSREVEPAIARLVDFFHRQNVAAILLYHTGKGGREYRGSTAIGATVDEVLTLRRRGQGEEDDFEEDGSDDGRRVLIQDGRNLRGKLQLTYRNGVYSLYEETSQPREKILAALRDHGVVTGRAELAKLAVVRKSDGLATIRELIGSGHIIESGKNLKLGSSGSAEFPQGGTAPEPAREPARPIGSHSSNPHPAETGTEDRGEAWEPEDPRPGKPRRINNGVTEVLRATQHGDRWFPELA